MGRVNKIGILFIFIVLLVSCNERIDKNDIFVINQNTIGSVPVIYNNKVKQIPQNDNYSCATTSVAMVISFYEEINGKPLDKDVVWDISKTDIQRVRKYGNDISGLRNISKYYGYQSEFMQNISYPELHYLLSKNIPVVIFINLFDPTITHAILVTGYDINKSVYFIQDPSSDDKSMPKQFLETCWNAWLSNPRTDSYRAGFVIFPKKYKLLNNTCRHYN